MEFIGGYDALAIYVHRDNPTEKITLEQLKKIYAEDGKITKWSQLGVKIPNVNNDEIVRVGRQSSLVLISLENMYLTKKILN